MTKNKTRATLSSDEKLYRAARGLFILMARQVDMGNKEMREILGGDQAEIDAVAKVVNKALRKQKIVE
jgi:hypothetical protein